MASESVCPHDECPPYGCMRESGVLPTKAAPGPENGYRGARYLRDTPYKTVTEWRRATIAAIPEAERCPKCSGSGADVILASNGGVGEVVRCWPCEGTGRRRGF